MTKASITELVVQSFMFLFTERTILDDHLIPFANGFARYATLTSSSLSARTTPVIRHGNLESHLSHKIMRMVQWTEPLD
jgi:hypothetical protein